MNDQKQVEKSHYAFDTYMSKGRWNSAWHQVDEVLQLHPQSVLEIGPGPGVFKALMNLAGVKVDTLDLDPDLHPDYIGSATELPFSENSYDVVCAFQMLEHLPYELSLTALRQMALVARRDIVISLPDSRIMWNYSFHIPKHGPVNWLLPKPVVRSPLHRFDGQHYWEINKSGYPLDKIIKDFGSIVRLVKTYRVQEMPYHRFFVFAV